MNQVPSIVIRAMLALDGIVSIPKDGDDWPAYVSQMPDGPNLKPDLVALYDTMGIKEGKLMRATAEPVVLDTHVGKVIEAFGMQVKVRGVDYKTCYNKIQAIALNLDQIWRFGIDIGTYLYVVESITRGVVIPMGTETVPNRRHSFSVNFTFFMSEYGPHAAPGTSAWLDTDTLYPTVAKSILRLETVDIADYLD